MCFHNSAIVAICFAVIFSTSTIAKDIAIYRWVDENSVVHFSQHQPQNTNYSELTTFASYKAKQQSKNIKSPSVDKQLTQQQYEKKQTEILAKNKVIAEKNCTAAQLNLKTLNSFSKITILDSDGISRVLTDKEKKTQITQNNKHVDLYCQTNKQS
ncbi:MAG: DUF4124 domain-containing protein [Colwellia sp.]|jgi:hypothetical protein|nr:MAG: DUF4124 domain-containing protein [Colwellia sp.]